MDATLSTINGEPTLRFERRLRHRPATVWRAVTEPAELRHWFPASVEVELRPGAPMRFTFPSDAVVGGTWDGEVLEVDEPRVFMFRWNQDVLRIELLPDGDGCRLVFTQTIGGGRAGLLGAGRTAAGWDTCLDTLTARLAGAEATERTDWLTPMAHYIDTFGLTYGTVESGTLHFAHDLVWKPPADVWTMLQNVPTGRILTSEAPHVLEYESPDGTARWEIVSDPNLGVRVELTVTAPPDPATLATWHTRLEQFFATTMGDDRPWSADRAAELTRRYKEQLG